MKFLFPIILALFFIGCATAPDEVRDSLAGDVESWRLVKKELVVTMQDGEAKTLWTNRLNAFIVRARANLAWANDDDSFDTVEAMKEEEGR